MLCPAPFRKEQTIFLRSIWSASKSEVNGLKQCLVELLAFQSAKGVCIWREPLQDAVVGIGELYEGGLASWLRNPVGGWTTH